MALTRSRPPLGRQIRWASPLTAGLVLAVLPDDLAGQTVGPQGPPTVGGTLAIIDTVGGRGIDFSAGGTLSFPALHYIPWPATVIVGYTAKSNFTQAIIGCGSSSDGWYLGQGDVSGADAYLNRGGKGNSPSGFNTTDGSPLILAASFDASLNGLVYSDGKRVGTASPGSLPYASSSVVQIGNIAGGGAPFSGVLHFAYMFRRVLTPTEIGAIAADPYQIYARPRLLYKSAGGAAYTLSPTPGAYSVAGHAAALTRGLRVAPSPGAYAITAAATPLTRGLKLAVATGAYAIAGTAAKLLRGLRAAVSPGAYSVVGNSAPVARGYKLTAATGSYAVTGNAAAILRALKLAPASVVYTVSGNPATLTTSGNIVLAIATGIFNVTGHAAALTVARKLYPATGAFSVTGTAAQLARGLKLNPATGAIVVAGNAAGIARGLRVSVTPGAYSLSGNAVATKWTRMLSIVTGVYQIIGNAVNFLRPGGAAPVKVTRVYAGPLIRSTRIYAGPLIRVTRVATFPS